MKSESMGTLWLLFLLFSILPSQSVVTVNRCCPPSQTLSKAKDRCVASQTPQNRPQVPLPAPNKVTFGLVAGRPGHGDVQADVEKVAMPGCGKTEAHLLGSEAWLTEKGRLVTRRYEEGFPLGEFCLEWDMDKQLVAVMCDPCQGRICLNVCCPHGKIYQPSYDYEVDPDATFHDECAEPEKPEPWSPQFWNHEEEVEVELERHSQYVLKLDKRNPNGAFYCQNDSILPYDVLFETFQLNDKGMAKGVFYENKTTKTFDSSQFCVTVHSDLDYDENTDFKNVTYFVCNHYEGKDDVSKCVNADFYSASLIISIIFLLLTIIAHILLPQLHSNVLGKMTIGFLINLMIAYICVTYLYLVRDSLDTLVGTTRCNFLGYLIQYSFLAFFFWQNSMAAYIFLKTTNIIQLNIYHDTKQFIIFFIFSQICPFFISIATAIVDIEVNDYETSVHVKPNMGEFSCFLGKYHDPPLPYVETAEFVYFHVFMIIIIILNVIYFTITLLLVCLARNKSGGGMTKNHIRIVLTLFFLMGIPWISEIINGVAQHDLSCEVMIFLDVINLFTGPLIFLVLVVKKEILMSLKNILMCRNGKAGVSRDNFGMTSLT